jgi:hypothetical protein
MGTRLDSGQISHPDGRDGGMLWGFGSTCAIMDSLESQTNSIRGILPGSTSKRAPQGNAGRWRRGMG